MTSQTPTRCTPTRPTALQATRALARALALVQLPPGQTIPSRRPAACLSTAAVVQVSMLADTWLTMPTACACWQGRPCQILCVVDYARLLPSSFTNLVFNELALPTQLLSSATAAHLPPAQLLSLDALPVYLQPCPVSAVISPFKGVAHHARWFACAYARISRHVSLILALFVVLRICLQVRLSVLPLPLCTAWTPAAAWPCPLPCRLGSSRHWWTQRT